MILCAAKITITSAASAAMFGLKIILLGSSRAAHRTTAVISRIRHTSAAGFALNEF